MPKPKNKTDDRARNFAFVLYPDSMNPNFKEILVQTHVPCFISPLHDLDQNPTGEKKKAHYHVILMFDGKKSKNQVQEIIDSVSGVGMERIESLRGYARYLCHLDNPEKHQYDINDVLSLNGSDYFCVIGLPRSKYDCVGEMMQFIREREIYLYADLIQYAFHNRKSWYYSLCDNSSYVIMSFLQSIHYGWTNRPKDGRKFDVVLGKYFIESVDPDDGTVKRKYLE